MIIYERIYILNSLRNIILAEYNYLNFKPQDSTKILELVLFNIFWFILTNLKVFVAAYNYNK